MAKPPRIAHAIVGIVETRDGTNRRIANKKVSWREYTSKRATQEAMRKEVDYAISRVLATVTPIEIDWSTQQVFAPIAGSTVQVASFIIDPYQKEEVEEGWEAPVLEAV